MARLWAHCISKRLRYTPFEGCRPYSDCAAEDAFANSEETAIGGWCAVNGRPEPYQVFWYHIRLEPSIFPSQWKVNPVPQRDIAFYEIPAQIVWLFIRLIVFGSDMPGSSTPTLVG